jgi:hypothetical protein
MQLRLIRAEFPRARNLWRRLKGTASYVGAYSPDWILENHIPSLSLVDRGPQPPMTINIIATYLTSRIGPEPVDYCEARPNSYRRKYISRILYTGSPKRLSKSEYRGSPCKV